MRLVRIAFANGDRALADTIEAYTQIQNYQLLQAEALLKLNNSKLEMANYLWHVNYTGYQLPANYLPANIEFTATGKYQNVEDLLALSSTQNPGLQIYNFKISSLEGAQRSIIIENIKSSSESCKH